MELPSFAFAASRDPLDRHALNAVACGISTRKYARSLEPLGTRRRGRSTSKSSVSRRYVAMTTKQMTTWLTTPLGDRHFPIVMIDGIHLGDHTGSDRSGHRYRREEAGSGASRRQYGERPVRSRRYCATSLDRGLEQERAQALRLIDGAKAISPQPFKRPSVPAGRRSNAVRSISVAISSDTSRIISTRA